MKIEFQIRRTKMRTTDTAPRRQPQAEAKTRCASAIANIFEEPLGRSFICLVLLPIACMHHVDGSTITGPNDLPDAAPRERSSTACVILLLVLANSTIGNH